MVLLASFLWGRHSWWRRYTVDMRQFSQRKLGRCYIFRSYASSLSFALGIILCPWKCCRDREGSVSCSSLPWQFQTFLLLPSLSKIASGEAIWECFKMFSISVFPDRDMYTSFPVVPNTSFSYTWLGHLFVLFLWFICLTAVDSYNGNYFCNFYIRVLFRINALVWFYSCCLLSLRFLRGYAKRLGDRPLFFSPRNCWYILIYPSFDLFI